MLSPSSPAQRNLGEEDSSGSDAGSEAGLEPETDRFGFIVTNGSTAGSVGPPPELVRQREAKWLNIIVQWDRILLKKTSKVKVQCQKGIPASLRAKCWPLLCGATDRMKKHEDLYQSLDSQPALQSWVDVIERDLDRQFPFHEMFLSKDGHGQRGLFRVLKAYTQYQPEEGYCQAQGPVAAVLLMNMPAEEAFWCLVHISEQYLPGYYSPLLEGVLFDAAMLNWVLKRTCPAAHKHLQHHGVEPLMFATDWLMCLFTRHLPFNTLLRVWDLFFCHGVRVLLQVAVVLVRRVLGRTEQRKQCPGQMETLERLRGVREEVTEEDDAFIAEVCSVPLSARDLEKQTEKELQKWRKDRPSSTFDPRGRCHGYRMVWARARQNEEERERNERQKGNLSVPLARSASTLSLSPSILHKRWRKGGKVNAGEWEGSRRIVRHLSMGAKEDWRSWTDLNFKKVQDVQEEEDVVSEERQSEPKLTGEIDQEEEPKQNIQSIPTERAEQTVTVKEQTEPVETRIAEKEKSQITEIEVLSEQAEETNVEAEPSQSQAKGPTVEIVLQPTGATTPYIQGEELDSDSQSQQIHNSNDQKIEVKDENEETENQMVESEHVEENQAEIQEDAEADTNTETEENVQQTQVDTVTEVSEPSSASETNGDVEAPTVKEPMAETETEQQQQEVIAHADNSSQGDASEQHSTESLAETDKEEEPHTQTVTETDLLAQAQERVEENVAAGEELRAEIVQTDSEQHADSKTEAETLTLNSPECSQPIGGAALVADTEVEIPARESSAQCSEEECDTEASEPTQEIEERFLTAHSEVGNDHTQAEETPTETQINEETAHSTAPPSSSAQGEEVDLTAESDGKTSSAEMSATEDPAPEQPKMQSTMGAVEEEENKGNAQERVEENVAAGEELRAEIVQTDSEQHADSKTEAETLTLNSPECTQPIGGAALVADTEVEIPARESSAQCSEEECDTEASEPTQEIEERFLTAHSEVGNDHTQAEETPTETQINEETAHSTAPPSSSAQGEEVDLTAESDGKTSSAEMSATEDPAPEQPKMQSTMGAVEEEENKGNAQENTAGEDDVFISTEAKVSNTDSNSSLTQASGNRSSRSSGDFCIRKSWSSRGSRLGRRLSEDLFIVPQKTSQSQSIPNQQDAQHTESESNPGAVNPTQTPPDVTERTEAQQEQTDPPKRFGLFRRLRGEQPKKTKVKGAPKLQVPKILIQDFSDDVGRGKSVEEEGEEKLSSRERRRRRRERERTEKEEERLKKKREKVLEKERERRKPETRGKSFQVQREKGSSGEPKPAKSGSQTHSASYAESYF